MLYQLLPFFLAIQAPADNGTWKFGPEYTFTGHLKMITDLERDNGIFMGSKLIFKLKCRPKINETLSCHFEDTKIGKIAPSAFNVKPEVESQEYKVFGMMNKNFEIKFNEKGIDSYVIEITEPRLASWCLDMTRLICNQLSVGENIAEYEASTFRALENYTNGECEVDFNVTRQTNSQFVGFNVSGEVELVSLDNINGKLDEDEMIQIEKKRDVHDCLVCTDYFYGSRYTFGFVYRDVYTKVKSSTSKISVSKKIFVAETVNKVELFDQDRKRQGDVLDHMMLRLESVLPAKDELPVLKDPVNMNVIANRDRGDPHVE